MIHDVDMSAWQTRNMAILDGNPATRPGISEEFTLPGKAFFAKTIYDEFRGSVWHYIGVTVGADHLIKRYDDNFAEYDSYKVDSVMAPEVVTLAVVLDYVVISSPSFSTIGSVIGGKMRKADSDETDNLSTSSIPVPKGLCVSWAGSRCVYASGFNLFISDPIAVTGGSPFTVVPENQISKSGEIFGLHIGAGGSLVVVTANGVEALPESSAATGQFVVGNWSRLSSFKARSYLSSVEHLGRVYGLTSRGYAPIDVETDKETEINDEQIVSSFIESTSKNIASMRAYEMDNGFVLADDTESFFVADMGLGFSSWWDQSVSEQPLTCIKGVISTGDREAFVAGSSVWRIGADSDTTIIERSVGGFYNMRSAGFFGRMPSPPISSPVVRRVDVQAKSLSPVMVDLKGEIKAVNGSRHGMIVGTDRWLDESEFPGIDTEKEYDSIRVLFAKRTDDISLSIGTTTHNQHISPHVSVKLQGHGKTRPGIAIPTSAKPPPKPPPKLGEGIYGPAPDIWFDADNPSPAGLMFDRGVIGAGELPIHPGDDASKFSHSVDGGPGGKATFVFSGATLGSNSYAPLIPAANTLFAVVRPTANVRMWLLRTSLYTGITLDPSVLGGATVMGARWQGQLAGEARTPATVKNKYMAIIRRTWGTAANGVPGNVNKEQICIMGEGETSFTELPMADYVPSWLQNIGGTPLGLHIGGTESGLNKLLGDVPTIAIYGSFVDTAPLLAYCQDKFKTIFPKA